MNKSTQRGFSGVVILVVILVLGTAGFWGARVVFNNQPKEKTTQSLAPTMTTNTRTPTQPKASTQSEPLKPVVPSLETAYRTMRKHIDTAQNFEQFFQLSIMYASRAQKEKFLQEQDKINSLSEPSKEQMFQFVKQSIPPESEVVITRSEIVAQTGTIAVKSKDGKKQGLVSLILEDNMWKLEKESWKQR